MPKYQPHWSADVRRLARSLERAGVELVDPDRIVLACQACERALVADDPARRAPLPGYRRCPSDRLGHR